MKPFKQEWVTVKPIKALGVKFLNKVPYKKAIKMVDEGYAVIANPYTIHKLFNRKSLRRYVRKIDKNTCVYCGNKGESTDYIVPPSDGGIRSPKNMCCVCMSCKKSTT